MVNKRFTFDICERELMWLDMVINVKKNLVACALAQETIIHAVILRVMVANCRGQTRSGTRAPTLYKVDCLNVLSIM